MGQDAQFNLGVVRINQDVAGLGHKGPADLPAHGRAHGDVLQVGIVAGDAPGGGAHLVKGGVDAALPIHQPQQRIDIGGVQLAHLAVQQDFLDAGVQRRNGFQGLGIGAVAGLGLALGGQAQGFKQHLAQLLGAVQVEAGHPGQVVDLLAQGVHLAGEVRPQAVQHLGVHLEAQGLHVVQHAGEGQLDVLIQLVHALFLQLLPVGPVQVHHPLGIPAGEVLQGKAALLGIVEVAGHHGVKGQFGGAAGRQVHQVEQLLGVVGDDAVFEMGEGRCQGFPGQEARRGVKQALLAGGDAHLGPPAVLGYKAHFLMVGKHRHRAFGGRGEEGIDRFL